jgi:Helix-turn-helix.
MLCSMRHTSARHTSAGQRDAWAAWLKGAREAAGLSITELGRRIGIARETVSRWESRSQRPESADLVVAVARELGANPDDALSAAGMRPGTTPPPPPQRPADPELDTIRESRLSPERKKQLIEWVLMRRARDEQARLDDLRHLMES